MNEEILKLKFEKIKNMGYVRSIQKGVTGIGRTFEDLLGIKQNNLVLPDFGDIEIKTKNIKSRGYVTLFSLVPNGINCNETRRLYSKYGTLYKLTNRYKNFNVTLDTNHIVKISDDYYFSLQISRKERCIYLCVSNKYGRIVDKFSYWDFSKIEDKVRAKLRKMALVDTKVMVIGGENYYNYFFMSFYKIKSFEYFVTALERGYIKICFTVDGKTGTGSKDKINDHGTQFRILRKNIEMIYDKYY